MNLLNKLLTGLTLSLIVFVGCEMAVEDLHEINPPTILQLSLSPQNLNFENENVQIKDTTIALNISGQVRPVTENTDLYFSFIDFQSGDLLIEDTLSLSLISPEVGNFDHAFSFEISTSTVNNYVVQVVATDKTGNGNYAQTTLKVQGVSNLPPLIIEANNPIEYQIPSSGSESVSFTAKVTDADGQNNIEGVFLRLFSRTTGEASNSPFELFDDGQSMGDVVSGDSLYTLTFPVSSDNQPDTYDLHYYAVDRSGLTSDTVKTTFTLIR